MMRSPWLMFPRSVLERVRLACGFAGRRPATRASGPGGSCGGLVSNMSNLEVRKFDWDFEGIPFIWNPEQPRFSVLMNQITFVIISFERYITKAMRAAESRITDEEVKTEARLFGQQEGVHSVAHQKHARALIAQYPGLQSILDKSQQAYDEQFESESLDYHLAYAGGLEAIFTPFFKMILNNRAVLFRGGDQHLSSMLLWA